MLSRLRPRSIYDVMAAVGCFAALATGTAYAANTIGSADIIDGEVKAVDIGTGEVGSSDVKDGSINTFDVHSFLGVDVVDNTLTGADVDESQLGTVPSAVQGGIGRAGVRTGGQTGPGECDPESFTFVPCDISATLNLPAPGRVLVMGSARIVVESGTPRANGECELATASGALPGSRTHVTMKDSPAGQAFLASQHLSMATVTEVLPAGQHSFRVDCRESETAYFNNARVTAVALSAE